MLPILLDRSSRISVTTCAFETLSLTFFDREKCMSYFHTYTRCACVC